MPKNKTVYENCDVLVVGGGMAGASLLQDSFKKSEEAKVHRDAINELGQSLEVEMTSKVIELNKLNNKNIVRN